MYVWLGKRPVSFAHAWKIETFVYKVENEVETLVVTCEPKKRNETQMVVFLFYSHQHSWIYNQWNKGV